MASGLGLSAVGEILAGVGHAEALVFASAATVGPGVTLATGIALGLVGIAAAGIAVYLIAWFSQGCE